MMTDLGARVQAYLRWREISQATLADEAGIHQSAVSRILKGPAVRNGKARQKLSIYMQNAALPLSAMEALRETWDGTDEHSEALGGVILATGKLRSKMRKT